MAVTIQANASGNAGDLTKWDEEPGDAIVDVTGPGALGYFTISGLHTGRFATGVTFNISGSTGNNGEYTVVSSEEAGGVNTEIRVANVPNATVDGTIKIHRVPLVTDTVDINGKAMVQSGTFDAAEIQDVAGGGSLTLNDTFDCPIVNNVHIIAAEANKHILRIGD